MRHIFGPLFLMSVILAGSVFGAPAAKKEKPPLKNLRFLNVGGSRDLYIPCPSTQPARGLSEQKKYFIASASVRAILAENHIAEPVSLVLYKQHLKVELGDFTPDTPEYQLVSVSREMLRQLVLDKVSEREKLVSKVDVGLAVKNTAGKIIKKIYLTCQFPFDYAKKVPPGNLQIPV